MQYEETFSRQFTYLETFKRSVEHYPNKNALTCTTWRKSWTYKELDVECNRLANAFLEAGVKKNDVIMGMWLNTAEYVFNFIATQKIGAIFSPINFRLAHGEVALHLEDSKPRAFFYDVDVVDTARKALEVSKHKPELVIMVGNGIPFSGSTSYQEFVKGKANDEPELKESSAFDEIVRLYTSGTTGSPKGVPMNSIHNLLRSYDVIMHLYLSPIDKTMNMTPWFHSGGLHVAGPCPTLHIGGEMVALKYFNADNVLDFVKKYGLTHLVGVPLTWEMLYQSQMKKPRDLKSLRCIVTMGAPLEREACLRYQKHLAPNIYNGYGTTETFWNTLLRPWELPDKAGTAGRACTDDRVRIVRTYEDRLAEPDELVAKDGAEEGEVIVQTPKTIAGYFNKPEEDKAHFYKSWFYTGDMASWDSEGFITIRGRKDDMLISGGESIHPVQVEECINEHEKVLDTMVIGVPDEKWGEVAVAYVVKKDPTLTLEEISEFCKNHPNLARYKRPRYFCFTDKLPYTATGKKMHYLMKHKAKEDFEAGNFIKAD